MLQFIIQRVGDEDRDVILMDRTAAQERFSVSYNDREAAKLDAKMPRLSLPRIVLRYLEVESRVGSLKSSISPIRSTLLDDDGQAFSTSPRMKASYRCKPGVVASQQRQWHFSALALMCADRAGMVCVSASFWVFHGEDLRVDDELPEGITLELETSADGAYHALIARSLDAFAAASRRLRDVPEAMSPDLPIGVRIARLAYAYNECTNEAQELAEAVYRRAEQCQDSRVLLGRDRW